MQAAAGGFAPPPAETTYLFDIIVIFKTAGGRCQRITTPSQLTGRVETPVRSSQSRGQRRRDIDVEEHAPFGGFDQLQRGTVCSNYPARPGVTAQLLQGCAVAGREPDRVTTPAPAGGRGDTRTLRKGVSNRPDDRRRDPGHIGQCDDPAPCRAAGGYATGDTGTHALRGLRVCHHLQAEPGQVPGEFAFCVGNDGDAVWQRRLQLPGCGKRQRRAVGQRVQQLVGAKAFALTGGKQDTGVDIIHAASLPRTAACWMLFLVAVISARMEIAISAGV